MIKRSHKSVTIKDIALVAGVSKSTVSLVLKNSPSIREETAKKVWMAVQKLGYVYNRGAANLRQGRSNIVGMIVNDLTNPFFVQLLIGVERVLLKSGYITLLAHTAEDCQIQDTVISSMRENNVAGIIICPAFNSSPDFVTQVMQTGLPMVVVIRKQGDHDYDYVGSDNYSGMYEATRYLLHKGHHHIAYIGRLGEDQSSKDRVNGYFAALEEAGIQPSKEWLISVPSSLEGGKEGINKLLSFSPLPSAVVCYNDLVAFGVLRELENAGLRAGKDIDVIGFDDLPESAQSVPPLTTLAAVPQQQGEIASRLLLHRLTNQSAEFSQHIVRPELILRSTA